MSFAEIERRCDAKDWSAALDLALAEWRRTRAPVYADLIDVLSSKTKAPPIPVATGKGEFHARWLERAANATESDVVPLLDTFRTELSTTQSRAGWDTTAAARRVRAALGGRVIGDYDTGPFMAISARIEALAALGPDPRAPPVLLSFLRSLPFSMIAPLTDATYGPVLDYLSEIRDVRIVPALEHMLSEPPATGGDLREFFERRLSSLLETLRRVEPVRPEEDVASLRDRLAPRRETAVRSGPDVAALFELIVQNLDDDAPRAVLADRWLEAGDPRGELVTLQLRPSPTPADHDRIKAIVWFDRDWLGDLAVVTRSRVYSRGFLDEIALSPPLASTPERWAAATRDPRLGTVRRLRCGAGTELHYRSFLFSPAMRNLEDAEVHSLALLREVLESPELRLRRLSLILETLVDVDIRNAVTAISARPEIEHVTLSCPSQRVTQLMSALPLATERLRVTVKYDHATIIATRTAEEGLVLTGEAKERMAIVQATQMCPGAVVRIHRA